jgi:ketosteroid isomerase-like protein
MSGEENVEIVTRIYAGLNEQRALPPELFASDCVTDWTDVAPDGDVLHGVAATQRALSQYFDTFDEFHVTAEVLRAGRNTVLTAIRDGGLMKGSSAEIWNDYFHAWTIRDGRVVRLSSHLERQKALEAVESQEIAHPDRAEAGE